MLQVMAIYFGPSYLLKIQISRDYRFYAVIISFVLNYAAYFAEIYRSGIESMPRTVRSSKYARIQQGTDFYEDYITTGN